MPRQRTGVSTRRFGIEMEGYIGKRPSGVKIFGANIKHDMSLNNRNWNINSEKYGVEITSRPIKTYSIISRIFGEMSGHDWSTDEKAGTHVHIEIKDFDEYEKLKLLRFCKGIEDIMLMFVRDSRNGNRYCNKLHREWDRIFASNNSHMLDQLKGLKHRYETFNTLARMGLANAHNSKYYWINIYGSNRPTAEFRIFHAVESAKEAEGFVKLAHAIVDTVKNSTAEQLEFIIMSLQDSETIESIAKNLYYAIGLSYGSIGLPLVGERAMRSMATILASNQIMKIEGHNLDRTLVV